MTRVIRVHGTRENNHKNVSIEISKYQLTVFTGVSGSGKLSMVFGTIAAESQRLINETYSAFVERAVTFTSCPDCAGTRLSKAARSSKIKGITIADACAMQVSALADWAKSVDAPGVAPLI